MIIVNTTKYAAFTSFHVEILTTIASAANPLLISPSLVPMYAMPRPGVLRALRGPAFRGGRRHTGAAALASEVRPLGQGSARARACGRRWFWVWLCFPRSAPRGLGLCLFLVK